MKDNFGRPRISYSKCMLLTKLNFNRRGEITVIKLGTCLETSQIIKYGFHCDMNK